MTLVSDHHIQQLMLLMLNWKILLMLYLLLESKTARCE